MNKPVFGLLLGGTLGIFDGLSALLSAPETAPDIIGIVIGSTFKGIIAGALIGWFARKVQSTAYTVAFGAFVGFSLALMIAAMPTPDGKHYYWEIVLPGTVLGLIVGYATSRYTPRAASPALRS